MEWFEIVVLGGLSLAAVLLLARMLVSSKPLRLVLLLTSAVLLSGVGLLILGATHPQTFGFVLPYQRLDQLKTTDAEGIPWTVDVSYKYLSNTIPPGLEPRLKLVARSVKGSADKTYDAGWRFGVSSARAVPGGIEVFQGDIGLRFELKGGEWAVEPTRVRQSTSLWEDRLVTLFKLGMSREAIKKLVAAHQSEVLPDLMVWVEGEYLTQHSLDREAALYVKYSAAGMAEKIKLKPRLRGTIDELKGEIDEKLLPLVALIHGSSDLEKADPVGLIRAVNGLRAAGITRATAALREYHRLTDPNAPKKTAFDDRKYDLEDDRLFPIIRLLFVPEAGKAPMPLIDMPWVRKPPPGETEWPLYPVTLENGFPFILSTRQLGGGSPQNPILHLDYCLKYATFRSSDITPEGSPIPPLASLLASPRWARVIPSGDQGAQADFLRSQVIYSLKSVLPFPEEESLSDGSWRRWVEAVSKLDPRWDTELQSFVRGGN